MKPKVILALALPCVLCVLPLGSCTGGGGGAAAARDSVAAAADSVAAADTVPVLPEVRYEIVKWKNGKRLVAWVDDRKVDTGFGFDQEFMCDLQLLAQADFNGDGYADALVYEWPGGNSIPPPFFVWYDAKSDKFNSNVEEDEIGFKDSRPDPVITAEQRNGQWNLLWKISDLRTDRYVVSNDFKVKKVEEIATVGKKLVTFTRAKMFDVDEENVERSVQFDLDGDGSDENIVFLHDTSHASNYGKDMSLSRIDGKCDYVGTGSIFAILQTKTNGMHDISIDNERLFKWNGKEYEQVE